MAVLMSALLDNKKTMIATSLSLQFISVNCIAFITRHVLDDTTLTHHLGLRNQTLPRSTNLNCTEFEQSFRGVLCFEHDMEHLQVLHKLDFGEICAWTPYRMISVPFIILLNTPFLGVGGFFKCRYSKFVTKIILFSCLCLCMVQKSCNTTWNAFHVNLPSLSYLTFSGNEHWVTVVKLICLIY